MIDIPSAIIESTHALVIVLDPAGRIVMFNPACERITGYRFAEIEGKPVWEFLLLPEEAAGVRAEFGRLSAGQFPSTYENHVVARSGERRLIEWSNTAVTDDRGRVTHVIGTGIDVTEQRRAQAACHEAEYQQRRLLDALPDRAWLKDRNGRYVAASRQFQDAHGVSAEELPGKTDFDLFPQSLAAQFAGEDRTVLAQGKPLRFEQRRQSEQGERWIEKFKLPIRNESGGIVAVAGIARDITDRKMAEAQRLARDATQRAALVKEVHHRIKNHLQGVVALLQPLRGYVPHGDRLLDAVIARVGAIAAMHGMFGAIEATEVALPEIVQRLVTSLSALDPALAARLQVRDASSGMRVAEHETVPLALVVNELIMNAAKHSGGSAREDAIEVVVDQAGRCARVVVRNVHGTLPARFDFDRAVGLGTGLGLVRSLLPPEGAELQFESLAGGGVEARLMLRPPVISMPQAAA